MEFLFHLQAPAAMLASGPSGGTYMPKRVRHLHAFFTSGTFCGHTPPSGPSEGIIVLAKMPKKVTSGHLLWVFSHPLQGLRRALSCLYKATTESLWNFSIARSHGPDRGNAMGISIYAGHRLQEPPQNSSKALFQNNVGVYLSIKSTYSKATGFT